MRRKLSEEHRRRISEALKRRNGYVNPQGSTYDELMKKDSDLSYLRHHGNSAKALKERGEKLERMLLEKDVQIQELVDHVSALRRHIVRLNEQIEDLARGRSKPVERDDSALINWSKEAGSPSSRGNE